MLAAGAGLGAGVSAIWNYNRNNFLYDRKLRQEQEFAIFEWRKVQAELWRDDVRDIIEMTERKMDNYLIVTVLQLGMCAGLFACGRLEPGTPPWLLHFYMLTLGGAFMYLLMSVWLAMHAGVVAQCASVRMLTQFVRLPVPDWHDFEGARTYAHAFESLRVEDMLRPPFTASVAKGAQPAAAAMERAAVGPGYSEWNEDPLSSSSVSAAFAADSTALHRSAVLAGEESGTGTAAGSRGNPTGRRVAFADGPQTPHADPWRLEKHGDERGFYELQQISLEMRRHIRLARRAALQFQCFDAFARLSMSFGTHQLLYALSYYSLGYLCIQDGVIWPAVCIVAMMTGISSTMMRVDFSMTRWEQFSATALVFTGMASSCFAVVMWVLQGSKADSLLATVLPATYIANFLWLLVALRACGIQEERCTGIVLPMKLRAVLYLDVFGWLSKSPADRCTPVSAKAPFRRPQAGATPFNQEALESEASMEQEPHGEPSPRRGQLDADDEESNSSTQSRPRFRSWFHRLFQRRRRGEKVLSEPQYEEVQTMFADVNADRAIHSSYANARKGLPKAPSTDQSEVTCQGPAGEISHPPEDAFEPTTYDRCEEEDFSKQQGGEEIVTGQDRLRPSKMPGRLFKMATLLLAILWAMAFIVPLEMLGVFLARPAVADIYFEKVDQDGKIETEKEMHVVVGTDVNGLPELLPIVQHGLTIPELGEGRRILVDWPSHSAFVPRALTSDPRGRVIVVADEFGLYAGDLQEKEVVNVSTPTKDIAQHDSKEVPKPRSSLRISFRSTNRCAALEGVAFNDIGVLCAKGDACDVFVLARGGTSITECPLALSAGQALHALASPPESAPSWRITKDWLEQQETVQSFTMRSSCLHDDGAEIAGDFDKAGCLVVGTSRGRIVAMSGVSQKPSDFGDEDEDENQMHGGSNDDEEDSFVAGSGSYLIPAQPLQDRSEPSTAGALTSLGGRITLALWFNKGTLSAFDAKSSLIGEWKLPEELNWLMLTSGGDHLFLLGVRKASPPSRQRGSRSYSSSSKKKPENGRVLVELHRFPIPTAISAAVAAARAAEAANSATNGVLLGGGERLLSSADFEGLIESSGSASEPLEL